MSTNDLKYFMKIIKLLNGTLNIDILKNI